MHMHVLFSFPGVLTPETVTIPRTAWLARRPLLRCVAIYRQMPLAFLACLALFVAANLGLALQQHIVGRAVHDLEQGRAVLRLPGGALDYHRALGWLAAITGVTVVRAAIQYGAGIFALVIGQELLCRLREAILVQVQRLDLAYHLRHGVGEIITRTTRDADKVRDALVTFWRNVIETVLVVASAIGLVTWYSPLLGAGPLLATAVGLALLLRTAERLVPLDRAVGDAYDQVNQDLTEGIHGVRVIKAFSLEASRAAGFEAAVNAFAASARRALAYAARHVPGPQVIVALGQVWVLGYGAYLVHVGRLDAGGLVASLLITNTLVFRVEAVGRVMQTFADARSSASRIMELLDAAPRILPPTTTPASIPAGPLGVRLRSVRVQAPGGDRDVLRDLNLTIAPGEIVAVVGATGAGKSTLAALLPRLAEPDDGTIAIGSPTAGWHDVRNLSLAALRRRVHVVPQESFLFSDTVAANLRVGRPDATTAELWQALRVAAADDVVAALPEQLDTIVGDRGVTLSGGQRQRLTLARALVAAPSFLALDDATSALDAVTERTILDNIRSGAGDARRSISMLLVASKLSTVLLADRVVVLAGGRIAAEGPHHQLVADSAAYRELLGIDDAAR
jgi:ABC-type multidrug transport system fused ATPase/permease subunit